MKKLSVSVMLLLFSVKAFSQANNQLFEMINMSFIRYVEIIAENQRKMVGKDIPETNSIRRQDSYIAMDNYPLGFEFSNQIKNLGFQFIFLQSNATKKIIKKPRPVVFMTGPCIDKNILTITFSTRTVVWRNGTINIAVSDWVKCVWQYSCDAEEWELITVDPGGI